MELKIMTFNDRYDTEQDGPHQWKYRKEAAARIIKNENPDILGAQEVLVNQFEDLKSGLNGYEAIGLGRIDGKE
jgi:endonuclease/exonuclease/phosphatase family metal-dependent hydrolase